MSKNSRLFGVIIGLVLFAIGIFAWSQEIGGNSGTTNLSQYVPWGLYIVFFLFLEAIGAGALFFGSLYKSSKLLIIGIASAIGAALAILPDLGSPLQSWRLLLTPNFSAPMMLDVWLLALNIICGLILLTALRRSEAMTKVFQICQYILSIALPLGTSWMFTTMSGKPGWGSALESGSFIAAAILAGFLVVYCVRNKDALTGVLVSAGVMLVLLLAETGSAFYSPANAETAPMIAILSGEYAWLFWIMILGLFALPIGLGIVKIGGAIPIVSLLGLGLLANKFLFIVKGSIFPYDRLGDGLVIPSLASTQGKPIISYMPSGYELLVALGIIGFNIVAYFVLTLFAEKRNLSQN